MGQDNLDDVATFCCLGGPESNPTGGGGQEIFFSLPPPPLGPTQIPQMGTGAQSGGGVALTTHCI